MADFFSKLSFGPPCCDVNASRTEPITERIFGSPTEEADTLEAQYLPAETSLQKAELAAYGMAIQQNSSREMALLHFSDVLAAKRIVPPADANPAQTSPRHHLSVGSLACHLSPGSHASLDSSASTGTGMSYLKDQSPGSLASLDTSTSTLTGMSYLELEPAAYGAGTGMSDLEAQYLPADVSLQQLEPAAYGVAILQNRPQEMAFSDSSDELAAKQIGPPGDANPTRTIPNRQLSLGRLACHLSSGSLASLDSGASTGIGMSYLEDQSPGSLASLDTTGMSDSELESASYGVAVLQNSSQKMDLVDSSEELAAKQIVSGDANPAQTPSHRPHSVSGRASLDTNTSTGTGMSYSSTLSFTSQRLSEARDAGRRRRRNISGTCFFAGGLLIVLGFCGYKLSNTWWIWVPARTLIEPGLVMCYVGVLPTDKVTIRILALGVGLLTSLVAFFLLSSLPTALNFGLGHSHPGLGEQWHGVREDKRWIAFAAFPCLVVVACLFLFVGLRILHGVVKHRTRALLELFWHLTFVLLGAFSFFYATGLAIALAGADLKVSDVKSLCLSFALEAVVDGTLALLVRQSSFRVRVQSWLASSQGVVNAAAIIAALVAGQDTRHVIAKSTALFRAVRCDELTKEMMADNKPNPAFFALSRSVPLGSVDAFLTHSWHDSADAKWEAIQSWREDFKLAHRREPTLWIDKFCINQENISDSLLCLPVFLSGCNRLLIVAGDTYLKRLWCIIELFVFLQMGGSPKHLELRPLRCEPLTREEAAGFDANLATCFDPNDKQHLLSIVEAGSDGMDTFNKQVQVILSDAFEAPTSSSARSPSHFKEGVVEIYKRSSGILN